MSQAPRVRGRLVTSVASTWKTSLANAGLLMLSLLATLMLMEHVVFRHILEPDDLLENVTINGVVRYMPGTQATFRHSDGRKTLATINADGWNSTKPEYRLARMPGRHRIAVIGDSYVHGAFVNVDAGFPEVMETELRASGQDVEVYRFGMDGAPLSQYLHVLRREVLQYKPDIVVVPLIHNDFDESYRFIKTRYASSFMKLKQDEARNIVEVEPGEFGYGTADALRGWRTFRYLYYKTNFYLYAKSWISRFFWGGTEDWKPEYVSSAVDIRKIGDHASNRLFARYVMVEMNKLAAEHNFKLAFAMDGVREAVYAARPPGDFEVGMLNRIAADLAQEQGLPFLDLQDAFAKDYAHHKQRFEFSYDWHWNEHANALVAREIAQFLRSDPRLALPRPGRAADAGNVRVK